MVNKTLGVGAIMTQLDVACKNSIIWTISCYLSRMRYSHPPNMHVLPSSGTKRLNLGLCIHPGAVVINLFHAELNC